MLSCGVQKPQGQGEDMKGEITLLNCAIALRQDGEDAKRHFCFCIVDKVVPFCGFCGSCSCVGFFAAAHICSSCFLFWWTQGLGHFQRTLRLLFRPAAAVVPYPFQRSFLFVAFVAPALSCVGFCGWLIYAHHMFPLSKSRRLCQKSVQPAHGNVARCGLFDRRWPDPVTLTL
jgi:hypothetical protein